MYMFLNIFCSTVCGFVTNAKLMLFVFGFKIQLKVKE